MSKRLEPLVIEKGTTLYTIKGRLDELELEGKSQLDALQIILLELEGQMKLEVDPDKETKKHEDLRWVHLEIAHYLNQAKWLEKHHFLPRTEIRQFDFDALWEFARTKTVMEKKRYWELILEQFELFVKPFFQSTLPFETRVRDELLSINAELALEVPHISKKLKWLRKPSEFGHLFSQLALLGYIQLPDQTGVNFNELARVCIEIFDFEDGTTQGNLAKELNPAKCSLSNDVRELFQIPDQSEMKPKRAKKSPKP